MYLYEYGIMNKLILICTYKLMSAVRDSQKVTQTKRARRVSLKTANFQKFYLNVIFVSPLADSLYIRKLILMTKILILHLNK